MSDEFPRSQPIVPRKQWFGLDSPIGVIGAFAALVEVALILASIFVDGNARWALIIFAAGVFIYVSTWFFWILTNKNWVLYPPREYGGETGVVTYVEAMKVPVYRHQGVKFGIQLASAAEHGAPDLVVPQQIAPTDQPLLAGPITIDGLPKGAEMDSLIVYNGPRMPNSLGEVHWLLSQPISPAEITAVITQTRAGRFK